MNIHHAIQKIRHTVNMSEEEFAGVIDVPQTRLAAIENGLEIPGKQVADRISQWLEIPLSAIYAIGVEPGDVPVENKKAFGILYPAVRSLILEMIAARN